MTYKYIFTAIMLSLMIHSPAQSQQITVNPFEETVNTTFTFGTATNPTGQTLLCDSRGLLLDGKPLVPVMGEIHYTRCNPEEWKRELLKMKAGGITIAATYIFWIHHEEEKGIVDWGGSRDLRRFLDICNQIDLPVILRVGPFCHGEVRGGGIPDWIVNGSYKLRSNDPAFLQEVTRWYTNIYNQVKGHLWKEGGPVIGIQLDNEFGGPWEYLQTLKDIAINIGFDLPLYTRTGWPNLSTPATFGEILPLYGDYSDGFWDRNMTDMPGDYPAAYLFRPHRISSVIASEQFTTQTDGEDKTDLSYPYFTCELGGGMMSSYHRRICIAPLDIHAMAITKIGSGSNLPGYYMYHGGTNPHGKHHTLNEQQNTPYMNHNDLPVMTYDFQAPLGEIGQISEHYHWLRRTHLFLADFGYTLSSMDAQFPTHPVIDARGDDRLRWAVRSNGKSGYLFVNNYQRMRKLSDKKNIRFTIRLPESTLTFPEKKITIPSGASFFFPFNMEFAGVTIQYATAQPIASIQDGETHTLFMAEVKGIPVEIKINTEKESLHKNLTPGPGCIIETKSAAGKSVRIIILDEATSLQTYKVKTAGKEYLILSEAVVTNERNQINFEHWNQDIFRWKTYPVADFHYQGNKLNSTTEGYFTGYKINQSLPMAPSVQLLQQCQASPARNVILGEKGVAQQPADQDFLFAARWEIKGLTEIPEPQNTFLQITYEGDVARIYAEKNLIQDNFYNGKPMYVRVIDVIGEETTLNILPLEKEYPIYHQQDIREKLDSALTLLNPTEINLLQRNIIQVKLIQ